MKEKILEFYKFCDLHIGSQIFIKSQLSTNKGTFDRHFTSTSEMYFMLENFVVRTSGARAMFIGENQSYEIANDDIASISMDKDGVYDIMEKLSDTVFRKTILHFKKSGE